MTLSPSAAQTPATVPQGPRRFVYRQTLRLPRLEPRRVGRLTCPHCWQQFAVEDTLFIARHHDLVGDALLGGEAAQRFLPSRFTPTGNALDPAGIECPDRACPGCHLRIPRCLYEQSTVFLSIVGAPGCGKSYFLTAMLWQLRRMLPERCELYFGDADARTNQWFHEFEQTLFFDPESTRPVALQKTEMQGDAYDQLMRDGMPVLLPRPSIFTLQPRPQHPLRARAGGALSRNLVLYDNAGEHFQPGMDSAANPGTQHLLCSQAIFFLFDPTREPRFARACGLALPELGPAPLRQDVLLTEILGRIAQSRGLDGGRCELPLIIVGTKCDLWGQSLGCPLPEAPFVHSSEHGIDGLDLDILAQAGLCFRHQLLQSCPELISAAEGFSRHVFYLPVSALGHAPQTAADGAARVRPCDIRPLWPAMPMLYLFAQLAFLPHVESPQKMPSGVRVHADTDGLRVELPDGRQHRLPRSFAGRSLRCPESGQPFVLPSLPRSDLAEEER